MQTFLPDQNFTKCARILDYRRLGKQRVEVKQILNALYKSKGGWVNHPAVRMWRGHGGLLARYGNEMILEWIRRGYKNTMPLFRVTAEITIPAWYNDPRLFTSHRAALLYKDYEHYKQFGWSETPQLNYYWPV